MDAAFRLAAVFGEHMVLGRNRPIPLFGEAVDGTTISALFLGRTATTVANNGTFLLTLPPMAAGGPYSLTVTGGQTTLHLSDVYIGEVYLAGGQSNMEMELQNADDGQRLIAKTDVPLLRFYNVPKLRWLDEESLAIERLSRWRVAKPGECAEMSAVAFHFAIQLQATLNVAVGVIDCYWGGTSAACWMDQPALRQTTAGTSLLDGYAARIAGKTDEQLEAEIIAHDLAVQAWDARVAACKAENPDMAWTEMIKQVGPCPWCPPEGRKSGYRPAGLVHTMVERVAPYPITGFIYYQGEEDVKHPDKYRSLMTTLITFWRNLFRDARLPFVFAQLPMFRNSYEADDHQWAALREAQEQTYRTTRDSGLAVLIDCGELDNIHPTEKKTVGERLCRQALKVAFGQNYGADSPFALYAYPEADTLVVALSAAVQSSGKPTLFEVAGADGVFYTAKAQIIEETLRLRAHEVPSPLQARYAWVNYGQVNVFDDHGLPLAPFWMR